MVRVVPVDSIGRVPGTMVRLAKSSTVSGIPQIPAFGDLATGQTYRQVSTVSSLR